MLAGHYATVLIPKAKQPDMPLWLLLILAQFTDFLFLILSVFGVEPVFDANTPLGFIVEMTFSHDLVPLLVQTVVLAGIVFLIYRRKEFALWAMVIVFFHGVLDFISGYTHHIFGPESPGYGLGNYATNPIQAFVIELAVTIACIVFFAIYNKRKKLNYSNRQITLISVILILPTVLTLVVAAIR